MFFCEQLLAHLTSAFQGSTIALCLSPYKPNCYTALLVAGHKEEITDNLDYSYSSYNSTWRMQSTLHMWTGLSMQNSFQSNVHYTKQAVTKNTLFLPPQMRPQHKIAGSKVKKEEKLLQLLKRQIQNSKEIIHSDSKYYIITLEA